MDQGWVLGYLLGQGRALDYLELVQFKRVQRQSAQHVGVVQHVIRGFPRQAQYQVGSAPQSSFSQTVEGFCRTGLVMLAVYQCQCPVQGRFQP